MREKRVRREREGGREEGRKGVREEVTIGGRVGWWEGKGRDERKKQREGKGQEEVEVGR